MSEIKVGEFVRSKNGALGKITKIVTEDIFYVKFYDNLEWKTDIEESGIIKHSPNIVDLIEVGDYVNGYKVLDVDFKNKMICLLMPFNEENKSKYNIVWNTKYFIKSIVTKEQFAESEYKV